MQTPIRIMQMDCPTEEALLRKKLGGMPGVAGMELNLMQRVLTVTHEPKAIESILEAVRSLSFTPEISNDPSAQAEPTSEPGKPGGRWQSPGLQPSHQKLCNGSDNPSG